MAQPPNRPHDAKNAVPDVRALMEQYGPGLRRYFQKRAAGGDVDDLVHDVFVRLLMRGPGQTIEDAERYLFRIAANVLAERYRREPWNWTHHSTLDDVEPVEEISPERIVASAQTLDRVMAAFRELPPRTFEAFILHRFEEMTYPAIARRLGISRSAVEKLIMRALDKLMRGVDDTP